MLIKHINPFNIPELHTQKKYNVLLLFWFFQNHSFHLQKAKSQTFQMEADWMLCCTPLYLHLYLISSQESAVNSNSDQKYFTISNNLTVYLQKTLSRSPEVSVQDNEFPTFIHCLKKIPHPDPLMITLQYLAFINIRSVSGRLVPGTDGNSQNVIHDLFPTVSPDGQNLYF